MEQNLIFHAVEEVEDGFEDCFETIANFVKDFFHFELDESDIRKAYRMGVPRDNRSRPIFTKLSYHARDKIMENVSVLKGKKNKHQQVRFISEQIPEGITESRKILGKTSAALKKIEDKKPKEQQRQVRIMGEKVVVGGQVHKPQVQTPQPLDLFPGAQEQKKINAISSRVREAQPLYSYNSTFVGLAVEADTVEDVNLAYKAVMQRFPYMDHVMMAYQTQDPISKQINYGSCDDNEHGGGAELCKFLYQKKLDNLAVFVVRRYGGIHLGLDRFNMIRKAAVEAIALLRPPAPSTPPTEQR